MQVGLDVNSETVIPGPTVAEEDVLNAPGVSEVSLQLDGAVSIGELQTELLLSWLFRQVSSSLSSVRY